MLRDVLRFAEAVEKLKDVVLAEGRHQLTPLTSYLTGNMNPVGSSWGGGGQHELSPA